MRRMIVAAAVAVLVSLLSVVPVLAQNSWVTPGGAVAGGAADMCLNSSNLLVPWFNSSGSWQCAGSVNVTGTFSASLGGFTPSASGARGTPFSVTTADSSGTLPTGAVVVVSNPGANPMYCNVNGVAATTSDQPIAAGIGNWFAFTIPSGVTTLHCIATGGSTTANMLGGAGLATGSGGGGGGVATTVTANQGTPTNWLFDLRAMGGTGINSGCVGALNGFSGTIPATTCGVFGSYILNATTAIGNNADGVAVSTGGNSPTISYLEAYNGTTFDRLQLDGSKNLKVTSIVASGGIASGALASGAFASGSVASGAYASGSLASGAVVDITNMSGTTAAGVPSKAIYLGVNVSGNIVGLAPGTAGTPSTQVLTVQGATSMTPVFSSNDPCAQGTKLGAPFSLTASGQVITGTSAKKTYICGIDVVTASTQNIALVEGTGTTCATNIFGLAGGTTAATGWNFTANGGIARGSGNGTVYSPSADTNGTAANVCLLLSGSGQTSGQIAYVQQ